MALLLGRNKVLGRIKQGGGPDLAHRPCVCHLCSRTLEVRGLFNNFVFVLSPNGILCFTLRTYIVAEMSLVGV